jgi:hypothetical protein
MEGSLKVREMYEMMMINTYSTIWNSMALIGFICGKIIHGLIFMD